MAVAATETELFNFEEQIERATREILSNAGIFAVITNASTKLDTKFNVRVSFEGGPSEHMGSKPNNKMEYDQYTGILMITVTVERPEDAGSTLTEIYTQLGELRAKVREAMQQSKEPYTVAAADQTEDSLKYLEVAMIKPEGSQNGFIQEMFQDFTALRYQLYFGILPTAWPTS